MKKSTKFWLIAALGLLVELNFNHAEVMYLFLFTNANPTLSGYQLCLVFANVFAVSCLVGLILIRPLNYIRDLFIEFNKHIDNK